jgi:hypothetical protein
MAINSVWAGTESFGTAVKSISAIDATINMLGNTSCDMSSAFAMESLSSQIDVMKHAYGQIKAGKSIGGMETLYPNVFGSVAGLESGAFNKAAALEGLGEKIKETASRWWQAAKEHVVKYKKWYIGAAIAIATTAAVIAGFKTETGRNVATWVGKKAVKIPGVQAVKNWLECIRRSRAELNRAAALAKDNPAAAKTCAENASKIIAGEKMELTQVHLDAAAAQKELIDYKAATIAAAKESNFAKADIAKIEALCDKNINAKDPGANATAARGAWNMILAVLKSFGHLIVSGFAKVSGAAKWLWSQLSSKEARAETKGKIAGAAASA